jgi:hypothetical protein
VMIGVRGVVQMGIHIVKLQCERESTHFIKLLRMNKISRKKL